MSREECRLAGLKRMMFALSCVLPRGCPSCLSRYCVNHDHHDIVTSIVKYYFKTQTSFSLFQFPVGQQRPLGREPQGPGGLLHDGRHQQGLAHHGQVRDGCQAAEAGQVPPVVNVKNQDTIVMMKRGTCFYISKWVD